VHPGFILLQKIPAIPHFVPKQLSSFFETRKKQCKTKFARCHASFSSKCRTKSDMLAFQHISCIDFAKKKKRFADRLEKTANGCLLHADNKSQQCDGTFVKCIYKKMESISLQWWQCKMKVEQSRINPTWPLTTQDSHDRCQRTKKNKKK